MKLPKIILTFFVVLFTFALLSPHALAAQLSLTKIGALDLQGQMYSDWWYTGTAPLLVGTATPNATVTVRVNETDNTTTANAEGNWSQQINTPQGDHTIRITSGEETIQFTLHAGQAFPGTSNTSNGANGTPGTNGDAPVPVTGVNSTVMNMLLASSLIAGGVLIHRKRTSIINKIRNI